MTEFHRNVAVSILNALLDEIKADFNMLSIEPAEALLVLNPVKISVATNQNHSQFGVNKLSDLYNFYGNISKDTYQQRTIESQALINCILESLTLEYSGYKNYVDSRKKQITKETEAQLNSVYTCLYLFNKFKSKKSTKAIESEISSLHEKIKIPLNRFDVLKDSVIESAFPNICYLVKLLAIVPMSEAVVEHRFSNMKLIMTDQRTCLNEKSLDTFMCISFHSSPLHCDKVKHIVNDWKN